MTSRESTFSSDLSTDCLSSTDNLSNLSVSCLRAATRSLAAFLAISLVTRARASSSSPGGLMSVLGEGDWRGTGFCANTGRAKRHSNTVHTKLDRTETSQRVNPHCSAKIILRGKKEITTEDTEEHRGEGKARAGALAFWSFRWRLQGAHIGEEFAVSSGLTELIDQQFHGFHGGQWVQHLAQNPDA